MCGRVERKNGVDAIRKPLGVSEPFASDRSHGRILNERQWTTAKEFSQRRRVGMKTAEENCATEIGRRRQREQEGGLM